MHSVSTCVTQVRFALVELHPGSGCTTPRRGGESGSGLMTCRQEPPFRMVGEKQITFGSHSKLLLYIRLPTCILHIQNKYIHTLVYLYIHDSEVSEPHIYKIHATTYVVYWLTRKKRKKKEITAFQQVQTRAT